MKTTVGMKITDRIRTYLGQVPEVAAYAWQKGWAEKNGGNISVNLTGLLGDEAVDCAHFRHVETKPVPDAARGMFFLFTGAGARFRELGRTEETCCIIRIDDACSGYHIVWGGNAPGFTATSEVVPHVKIHLAQAARQTGRISVFHTHATELLALTHHPVYGSDGTKLNEMLWKMLPEVRAFVPRGVKLVPYALPGSDSLAQATAEALGSADVALWAKHGAFAAGTDVVDAFDYIDVANKGAVILLKCLAAGYEPTGLSDGEMSCLEKEFNLPTQE
jgi:rhamnulose-1-phosphate aldolase